MHATETRVRGLVAGVCFAASLAGCALVNVVAPPTTPAEPSFITVDPARREGVGALIAGTPMRSESIVRRKIAEGAESSVFLVRIGDREEPHRHTQYDLTVYLVEGKGTLWLDGQAVPMDRGDVAHVPRDVPHYFVNGGASAASAVVVFSPRFTGPDSEPTAP